MRKTESVLDETLPDLGTSDPSKNRVEAQFPLSGLSFCQSHISDADNDFHA